MHLSKEPLSFNLSPINRLIKGNLTITIPITDLIIVVVILLERDINRLVVEAREVLELVEP